MSQASANRVNDFTIKIATVNGTGSASANSLLMKSIFRSGIPVMGKNYFPSNIQGLPTWYEIRVTRDGYAARAGRVDIMVAMNAETYQKDVRELVSGGLKTGRVMVKDEDVCLHCGLCAERCPTGAWDMKKYLIDMTHADDLCRTRHQSAA